MRLLILNILLSILVAIPTISHAQNSDFTEGELNEINELFNRGYIVHPGNKYLNWYISNKGRDVIGDPYLNEDFIKGFVQINANVKTDTILLRYNSEKNVVEFVRGEDFYGIDPTKIEGFTLFANPKNLVFKNGFKSDKYDIKPSTLLRIMYDSKNKFVAHHTTSLKENIATYGSANQKDEYVDNTTYYLIKPSGEFFETKLKRKSILKLIDKEDRDQIANYAKQQNLSFDEEADLVKILNYYKDLKSDT